MNRFIEMAMLKNPEILKEGLRNHFTKQKYFPSLTIISKWGIVTISFPVNPEASFVRSGRKMKVLIISKLTVSSFSLSTKSVFSFHSLFEENKKEIY